MTVAWGLLWGGSRSAKPCVFSGAAGDVAQLLREAVAGTFFGSHTVTVASSCFGCVCVCVCSSRVLESVDADRLEWLHDCCYVLLPRA